MATPSQSQSQLRCEDFMAFQETLKKMRLLDDRIIYALNTSIPTDSFSDKVDATNQCKHLYGELSQSNIQRESAIKRCINIVSSNVSELKEDRVKNMDDAMILKKLRKQQGKLRLLQSELNIEEVVKDRTLKVFYERCRPFYLPPESPII